MFNKSTRKLSKRLLMLGVLAVCLTVQLSTGTRAGAANACCSECWPNYVICRDSCYSIADPHDQQSCLNRCYGWYYGSNGCPVTCDPSC